MRTPPPVPQTPHRQAKIRRVATTCLLLGWLLLGSVSACGAPASKPADGPIADQIQTALTAGSKTFDHAAWGRLLAESVRDGQVDYAILARRRAELDAYLTRVGDAELASLTPPHLMALLLNAYNALTVRSILDAPGVDSIRDIEGVWTERTHRVGGQQVTLDAIEHRLLRPFFQDPRIHFAVNCASASCAPLPPWAFDGDRLEEQLEERTRSFLTDPRNVRLEGGVLYVSKYFDWYGTDFAAAGWKPRAESWLAFLAAYATPEVRAHIDGGDTKTRFLDYDWSLNGTR